MKRTIFTYSGILLAILAGVYVCISLFFDVTMIRNDRGASCQSNLKQIGLAMFMYNQDNDEVLPPAIFYGKSVGWANVLEPYLKSYSVFQCPREANPQQKKPNPSEPGFTDYWLNNNLAGVKDENVMNPKQLIMFGDGDGGSSESTASYAINHLPASWLQLSVSPMTRHHGGANYEFADGHVQWLKPQEILQLHSSKSHTAYTFANK